MSDTTNTDAAVGRFTPSSETRIIKDSLGRSLELRSLDPADILNLLEAAGQAGNSAAYMQYLAALCTVSGIDGIPYVVPANKGQIIAHAKRVGTTGLAAVNAEMEAEVAAATGVASEAEVAKN